jgi:hypothetical protein
MSRLWKRDRTDPQKENRLRHHPLVPVPPGLHRRHGLVLPLLRRQLQGHRTDLCEVPHRQGQDPRKLLLMDLFLNLNDSSRYSLIKGSFVCLRKIDAI